MERAVDMLTGALAVFKQTGDYDRVNTTAKILSDAYVQSGNYVETYEDLITSMTFNDTIVKERYDEEVAVLQTEFKVDEKDNEITLLEKGKQLQGQKLQQQKIIVITAITIAVVAVSGIILAVNR